MEHASSDHEASSPEEPAKYAFLNHSTNTLVNKLPPDVDNKPLARQKRKRTSPEDQAVLEAAYARDPKPDKDARLRLVELIALGEKEVQIWFQNRRQTSRRKSRPLLPHEIAQFQMSRYGTTGDGTEDLPSSDPVSDSSPRTSSLGQLSPDLSRSSQLESRPEIAPPPIQSSSAPPRSLPSLSQVLENLTSGVPSSAPLAPGPILKKSSSFVRLSMTSEGAAKVITKDSLSPSPPRPIPASQDSIGAEREASPSRQPQLSQSNNLKRSASGRSRDSRAWEFWCDRDSRSELEEKAQQDGRGSAADAIGVIRAASTRRALQPVAHKQNTALLRYQARSKHDAPKRPGLHRSQTSDGRLQHCGNVASFGYHKRKKLDRPPTLDASMSIDIPGNESDKENWSPGAEQHVLSKKDTGKLKHRENADTENVSPDADPEVAAFMKGRSSRRVHVDEELDCVQGLLSLSQGNWAR